MNYSQSSQRKHDSLLDKESLDLNVTLFNKSKNSDMGCEFKQYEGRNNDQFFDLNELWCIFLHRSVHNTRLALLQVVSNCIYGNRHGVSKQLLSGFGYDDSQSDVILKYLQWRIDNGEASQCIIGKQLTFNAKLPHYLHTYRSHIGQLD